MYSKVYIITYYALASEVSFTPRTSLEAACEACKEDGGMFETSKLELSVELQELHELLPPEARRHLSRRIREIFELYENEITTLRAVVQRLEWHWVEGTPLPPLQEPKDERATVSK